MKFCKNLEAARLVPVTVIKQLGHAVALAKVLVEDVSFWLPVLRA